MNAGSLSRPPNGHTGGLADRMRVKSTPLAKCFGIKTFILPLTRIGTYAIVAPKDMVGSERLIFPRRPSVVSR